MEAADFWAFNYNLKQEMTTKVTTHLYFEY